MQSSGRTVLEVSARISAKLSDAVNDQGVIAVAAIPEVDDDSLMGVSRLVVLDGVQDPGNVGTIVRCGAWFGFDAVLAGPGTADFFNPKTVRSMAGAMWDLSLHQTDDLVSTLGILKAADVSVVGTSLTGEGVGDWHPTSRMALILGSEAHGLSASVAALTDTLVRIEGGGRHGRGVESLNVAVAAGILMHRMRV